MMLVLTDSSVSSGVSGAVIIVGTMYVNYNRQHNQVW